MKKEKQTEILEKISILNNQRLNYVHRAGTMATLGFGEIVKNKVSSKNDKGEVIAKEVYVSKYALHIDCSFRISHSNEIILTGNDIFRPNSKLAELSSKENEEFDWDMVGNNAFDEITVSYFSDIKAELTVKSISVNEFGDLSIKLSNDFCLDIFVDVSEDEECWRLFEVGNSDKKHLVVTGKGYYEE